MDIDDVSEKYAQLLDKHKETLVAARSRQGERPTDMKSRRELVNEFMMQSITQQRLYATEGATIHSSFVPLPYLPSTTSWEELKKIFIKDLRLETHHRGNYVLLRAITHPNRMTALMAIVEDEREDAVMLQLYQQPEEEDRPAVSVIEEGDVVLVKEPYFKIMSDGSYGLRVDHVSDLVPIEADSNMVPEQWCSRVFDLERTADDCKVEGNDAMKRKEYWRATKWYALRVCTACVH